MKALIVLLTLWLTAVAASWAAGDPGREALEAQLADLAAQREAVRAMPRPSGRHARRMNAHGIVALHLPVRTSSTAHGRHQEKTENA